MTVMTTGQAIAESLIAHGVDTVFGIPGAHMYDFNDALAQRRETLRFITTRHEQGAGYMAYGYAKSTGRPGVYTVVPGPGLLNSAAALCTAYGATAPVLCITGNIMSHLIGQGRGQLHELPDQLALAARPHQVGRAHRSSDRGAARDGGGLSPARLGTRASCRGRGTVERIRYEGRGDPDGADRGRAAAHSRS